MRDYLKRKRYTEISKPMTVDPSKDVVIARAFVDLLPRQDELIESIYAHNKSERNTVRILKRRRTLRRIAISFAFMAAIAISHRMRRQ